MLVVGALHGNEPAGIEAGEAVLAALREQAPAFRGTLTVLAGNLAALAADRRFLDRDLNRMWLPERVEALEQVADPATLASEDRELRLLWDEIRTSLADAPHGAYLIDLHTSSAPGCPFMTVGDTLRNRRFAANLPLPLILGLEEQIDGPLLEFLNNLGLVTLCVEGGQHRDPLSAEYFRSALWLALVGAGMLDAVDAPRLDVHRDRLSRASQGVPRVVEVRHRHPIRAGDGFRMELGYSNFRVVRRGEVLAHDVDGPIAALEDGMVLLPLYQGLGDDGFFLARAVRPFWLAVSALARRFEWHRLFRRLPGVEPHPTRPDALVIDTRVARLYSLEIGHLLGYRRLRRAGDLLEVERRRYDREPPERYV
jgi:succinylglutamate desuccinylase